MLIELPKVSISNDGKVLETAERYIERLREIWVNDVMKIGQRSKVTAASPQPITPVQKVRAGYGSQPVYQAGSSRSFCA
jgi:hypothetical protein